MAHMLFLKSQEVLVHQYTAETERMRLTNTSRDDAESETTQPRNSKTKLENLSNKCNGRH